jgi:endoglucanase Acf2
VVLIWFLVGARVLAGDWVGVGAGGYTTSQPGGTAVLPRVFHRGTKSTGSVPSNDWWSSLLWSTGTFAQFPHPLAVKLEASGLRVAHPGPDITASRAAIMGGMPGAGRDFIFGLEGVDAFADFAVDDFSDWFVTVSLAGPGEKNLRLTYGHGSPFVFATAAQGPVRLQFTEAPKIWSGDAHSAVLGLTVNGHHYGVFGPSGSAWRGLGSASLTSESPAGNYFSVAVLPDAAPSTLRLFTRYAYAHVETSTVNWRYDEASAEVITGYRVSTRAREGTETGTLLALYPHQWRHCAEPLLPMAYASVRGPMKLRAGSGFETRMVFSGVLPAIPSAGGVGSATISNLLRQDFARPVPVGVGDTYSSGKQMGRLASAIPLADLHGLKPEADAMRENLRLILERWLAPPAPGARPLFYYDRALGTLIGYPASFGSDTELNDHHFHYGYFIKAAAELARHDPGWAAENKFGGMIRLLIRDIASPSRSDPLFPFLRCFDPYAGHSWASGHARFGDGNNNESSSEAMNAWCGIILLGEALGDRSLRDLGIYLFTTESKAIEEYWFDVHGSNFPASYPASVVTMVWGGKGANATWFSGDPQMVHGINFLPLHGGSLYLGLFPGAAEKNYAALRREFGSDRFRRWPDILWMYRALSDSADAVRLFEESAATVRFEDGNSRANTAHWIYNLRQLGPPRAGITADYPIYSVFDNRTTCTHAVYNLRSASVEVKFSDGTRLSAAPHSWAVEATKH